MREDDITAEIVDAAVEVHRTLGGPGLLESVYEEALAYELRLRHIYVERQKDVPVVYKEKILTARCVWICWFHNRLLSNAKPRATTTKSLRHSC